MPVPRSSTSILLAIDVSALDVLHRRRPEPADRRPGGGPRVHQGPAGRHADRPGRLLRHRRAAGPADHRPGRSCSTRSTACAPPAAPRSAWPSWPRSTRSPRSTRTSPPTGVDLGRSTSTRAPAGRRRRRSPADRAVRARHDRRAHRRAPTPRASTRSPPPSRPRPGTCASTRSASAPPSRRQLVCTTDQISGDIPTDAPIDSAAPGGGGRRRRRSAGSSRSTRRP